MKKLIIVLFLVGCSATPSARTAAFCSARLTYKLASAGKLDAPPGSPRAKLEAAEDAFCASVTP